MFKKAIEAFQASKVGKANKQIELLKTAKQEAKEGIDHASKRGETEIHFDARLHWTRDEVVLIKLQEELKGYGYVFKHDVNNNRYTISWNAVSTPDPTPEELRIIMKEHTKSREEVAIRNWIESVSNKIRLVAKDGNNSQSFAPTNNWGKWPMEKTISDILINHFRNLGFTVDVTVSTSDYHTLVNISWK